MKTEIGVYQPGMGWSYEQLREFYVEADKLGFDSAWMMDNVVYGHISKEGEMVPVFETWTVLPALAEATSRIKLGPMLTPVNRRHPALFAKITSTFDRISNGRLQLGIGTGDSPKYHKPWGMPFNEASVRIETLREEIQVLKLMWTEEVANFKGKYYTLTDATMDPKPIQKPHPPICVGLARSKATYKVAAELADGINVYNGSDRAAREVLDNFKVECEAIDKDYDRFSKSRCLNVVLLESEDDLSYLEPSEEIAPSLPLITGTADELAKYHKLSLDEQTIKLKEATNLGYKAMKTERSRVHERFVIGMPNEVAAELNRISGIGFDIIIIQGLDSIEDLRKFGKEVMPKVRGNNKEI